MFLPLDPIARRNPHPPHLLPSQTPEIDIIPLRIASWHRQRADAARLAEIVLRGVRVEGVGREVLFAGEGDKERGGEGEGEEPCRFGGAGGQ